MIALRHILSAILVLFVALIAGGRAQEPAAEPVKVSILTPKEKAVDVEALKKLAPGASVTMSPDGNDKNITRFTVDWKTTKVLVNLDEKYDQKLQNEGALGWISRFPEKERSSKTAAGLIAFIPKVKRTYGIVLPEGFDAGGLTTNFLLKLAAGLDGRLLANDTFYDSKGFALFGVPGQPPLFGRRGGSLLTSPSGGAAKPEELLEGTWDVSVVHRMSTEEIGDIWLNLKSVDEFKADGTHHSKGIAEIAVTPADGTKAVKMRFNLEHKGQWSIKDDKLVLLESAPKISNAKCEDPANQAFLDSFIEAYLEESPEPEENWLISRSPDIVYQEEVEVGIIAEMKRRGAAKPAGKAG